MRILKIDKANTFLVGIMMMVILLCGSSQVQAAQVAWDGGYGYTVTNGQAQITGYVGVGGATVPNTLGGFPVTSIGDYAFQGDSSLTTVTIPQGVTSIGKFAFSGCQSLTTISIPESVTSIGWGAFSSCRGLTSISLVAGNLNFVNIDGVLYNKAKTILMVCPAGLTTISIPESVTSIDPWAFDDCKGLTTIDIPQGVTSIGIGAFYGCTGLTTINIPQGVISIEMESFTSCTGLTNIRIPESVTSIGDGAIANCTGLTSITIPQGVTSIGYQAFSSCIHLTTIRFNSATTKIHDNSETIPVATKIIGYDPSTAKDYAAEYKRNFEVIGAVSVPVTSPTPVAITTLAGSNSYGTSLEIAKQFVKEEGRLNNLVIATGGNWPDALSGSSLARSG